MSGDPLEDLKEIARRKRTARSTSTLGRSLGKIRAAKRKKIPERITLSDGKRLVRIDDLAVDALQTIKRADASAPRTSTLGKSLKKIRVAKIEAVARHRAKSMETSMEAIKEHALKKLDAMREASHAQSFHEQNGAIALATRNFYQSHDEKDVTETHPPHGITMIVGADGPYYQFMCRVCEWQCAISALSAAAEPRSS